MENVIPLKILAKDTEDLNILSACVQDGLILVNELEYNKNQQHFLMLVNRYRWEEKEADSKGSRIHSALSFEHVITVHIKGLDKNRHSSSPLSLLTLSYQAPYIYITCSDNISIRLEVKQLKVKLRDSSLAWPAKTPCHLA